MATAPQFLVDTNILVSHLRQKSPTLLERAIGHFGVPTVSEVVVFELEVGAIRSGRKDEFQTHFSYMPIYPLTQEIFLRAAQIQVDLLKQNQIIGLIDTFIGATALIHNLPLFTLNLKHFQRIISLEILTLP
jgi:tRNA(fMet)-specific endonuclease VapC